MIEHNPEILKSEMNLSAVAVPESNDLSTEVFPKNNEESFNNTVGECEWFIGMTRNFIDEESYTIEYLEMIQVKRFGNFGFGFGFYTDPFRQVRATSFMDR